MLNQQEEKKLPAEHVKDEDAIKASDQSNPNSADAHFSKGYTLYNTGKKEEAIIAFNQAINLDPKYADAYVYKSIALANLGKEVEAILTGLALSKITTEARTELEKIQPLHQKDREYIQQVENREKAFHKGVNLLIEQII